MKKIFLSILVLISFTAFSQKKHYGNYQFDSLYSKLAQQGIDTTNFKIVVQRVSDGKFFKMYWPVFGGSTPTLQQVTTAGNSSTNLLKYSGNYGGSYDARTLVDKNYVDSARNKARDSVVALITNNGVTILKNYVTQTTSTGSGSTDNVTIVNIPANTLSINGDGLEIEVAYTTTGTDTKSVDVKIGSSSTFIGSSASTTAGYYAHKIKVFKTSSSNAIVRAETLRDNNIFATSQGINTSFDWTASQNLVVTLTSTTAASITLNYVSVKLVKENLAP